MSLLKKLTAGVVSLSMVTMIGCGGGGGGGGSTSTGGVSLTHAQVAAEFVRRMNLDLAGYDVSLVKTNTLQYDYIVVYDYDFRSYDAYYIGAYSPGQNLYNYLNNYNSYFYYDLIPETGNYFYDPYTGIRFQKGAGSSRDQAKVKAFKQQLVLKKASEEVQVKYGLSADKAMQAARFAYEVKTQPEGSFSNRDFDAFAKEFVGSTISEFQEDIKANNNLSLAQRIAKAGDVTGIGPAGVNRLMQEMFLGQE